MNKKVLKLFFIFLTCCYSVAAQEAQKSELHQRAEAVDPSKDIAKARSLYIHAFNDYSNKGQLRQGVECAVKATPLYYKEGFWKEAFELLRHADQVIIASQKDAASRASLHYLVTKERLQMYMRLRKVDNAKDQLNYMESLVRQTNDESLKNDLLYSKAIYYYTFGFNAQGNAVFKEMADKLTAQKEYDKVDQVYQTLIDNGRKSGSANLVAQSYSSYIAWKDSVTAQRTAEEMNGLKQQIANNEAAIADRDSSLTTRKAIIIGLSILLAALAVVLVIGGMVLLRFILLTRKQKKTINLANESNALKAKFISNISAQLEPTFRKLDSRMPEVKALLEFSSHIQTLSDLENTPQNSVEYVDTAIQPFCEKMMESIREKVRPRVTLTVNAPKMNVSICKEYVSHILQHLLVNAAEFTPEGGTILLEAKKRGPHTYQILVSDTGQGIDEEQRDNLFKPFLQIRDLTQGDGLGLPICKQMALKMNGDLDIDPQYNKGTRFILELHT